MTAEQDPITGNIITHDLEGDMEDTVEFTPDDELLDDAIGLPVDEHLFRQSQHEGLQVFIGRREQYGDHLTKAHKFPKYLDYALYIKCVRIITDIEQGETPSDDTLLDTANYCHMIRSAR